MPALPGLHDRLNRISHWDVNVSDRERSREWYEATTPLRVVAETVADQSFPGFGLAHGRFEGYLLRDQTQTGNFPMIHLVQWTEPRPVGTPYLSHANVGWYRIVPQVADLEEARRAVVEQGGRPFCPTTDAKVRWHPEQPLEAYKVFAVHDPDGITVEFANPYGDVVPATPRVVAHNTADVDGSFPFYVETLGLDFLVGLQTPMPLPNVYSPLGGETECDGALLGIRGDSRCFFDWLQWKEAATLATPYREPHHLGIVRCAIEVDDVEQSHRILARSSWAQEGRIALGAPEEWDLGPQFGSCSVVCFTDPEGVGFQLVQQRSSPHATLHPFGRAREAG